MYLPSYGATLVEQVLPSEVRDTRDSGSNTTLRKGGHLRLKLTLKYLIPFRTQKLSSVGLSLSVL